MKRFRQMAYLAVSVLALVLMSLAVAAPASASVRSLSARPASGLAGNGDSYTVNFMTAMNLGSGGTITLAFPAGFNLASVTAANVQLTYAGTVYPVNWVQVSGTTLTIHNPGGWQPTGVIGAGNPVSVTVGGVTNPTKAGTYTLQVSTQTDPTPVSASFAIYGNAPSQLTVTGQLYNVAGASSTLTISATDSYGNPNSMYSGDLTVTFFGLNNGPNGALPTASDKTGADVAFNTPTTVTFTNGVGTTTIKAYGAGAGQSIAVTESTLGPLSGSLSNFNVDPAPAAKYQLAGVTNVTAGSGFALNLLAVDAYKNPVNSGVNDYNGDKSLTFSGLGVSPNGTSPTAQDKTGTNIAFGTATTLTFSHGVANNVLITPTKAGTGLQVSVTDGTASATSAVSFNVSPLPAAALAVTGAQDILAGGSLPLTINATDRYGNVDPSFTGDKLVTFSGPFTAPIGNLPTAQDKNGIIVGFGTATTVSFNGGTATTVVKVYAAVPNQFVAATQGLLSGTSGNFNVTPAAMAALKLTGQQNIQAGGSFPLIIEADDAYGNPNASGVNNFTGPQMLNFSGPGTSPNGTRPTAQNNTGANVNFGFGTYVTFTNGTASTRVTAYSAGTNQQVFASLGTVIGASGSFNVTGLPASIFGGTGYAANQVAGGSFAQPINATDAFGNIDPSYTGDKTLTFGGLAASPNGTSPTVVDKTGVKVNFGLPTTVTFTGGTATAVVNVYGAGTNQTMTVKDGSGLTGTPATFDVAPQTATALALTGAQNIVAGVGFTLTINYTDAYGNVSIYTGDQTVSFSGLNNAPNGAQPTALDKTNANVNFGTATTVFFMNGVGTTTIKAYGAGASQLVAAKAGTLSGSSSTFNVDPAPATTYQFSGVQNVNAGTGFYVRLQAVDAYGNPVNSGANDYNGDKSLTFSGLAASPNGSNPWVHDKTATPIAFGSPTTLSFSHGVATNVLIAPVKAGTGQQISVTDGTVSATSGSFTVSPQMALNLAVTGAQDIVAGGNFTLTFNATDRYGNLDTSYTGDKTLNFNGLAASPNGTNPTAKDKTGADVAFGVFPGTTVSFSGGTATTVVKAYAAGSNQSIWVTQQGNQSGRSVSFNVTPAPPAALNLTGQQNTQVGGSFTLSIQAVDPYGNIDSSGVNNYTGDKTLTFSNLTASPNGLKPTAQDKNSQNIAFGSPTTVTFTNGSASAQVTATLVGTNQQVTVTDGTLTASTGSFTVAPGRVSSFTLTPTATTTVAGTPLSVTVQAFDLAGNLATNYPGTVTLSSTDSSFTPVPYTYTPADAGSHTFTVTLNTPGSQTISVTQLTKKGSITGSVTITVTPSCIPTVDRVDVRGLTTVAAGQTATFTATGSSACAGPQDTTFTWSATNGVVTPGGVWTAPTKPGTYTVTATAANGIAGTATVQVTPGPAALVTVTPAGSSTGAGNRAAFSAAVTDAYGNALTGIPVTWSATDGVITPAGLWTAPTKPGTYTVTATTANGVAGTVQIAVMPAPAARVTVTPAGSSVAAGSSAAFSAAVTDAYGNAVTGLPVTWSAAGGTISSGGLFTAGDPGTGTVTATIQSVSGPVSGSATITITGALADNGTGGTSGNHDTGGSPVVTSDRGTVADQAQPAPAGATVLTQPVVISGSGTVTATFHVPNAPQEPDTLVYYWDANLKHWIAVPTTFGPDGPVAQVPAGVPVSLLRGSIRQSSDTLTSWANPFVLKAQSLGLLSGMPDGAFHPNDPVTRYQMATVVALAAGLDVAHADRSVLSKLSDADQIPDWARPYVAATLSSGLMVGNGDGFAGDRSLTRAQVASLLGRLLLNAPSTPLHFTDSESIPSWAQSGLAKAVAADIITGMADGAFHPNEPLTRAQIATIMTKFLDYAAAHR